MAFSGGGDSLALLIGAKAWADRRGRRLAAVTVDHRLRPDGATWALWCRRRARALEVDHDILVWQGDKPASGVAAAARAARHGLLAEAARRRGAGVILMGHTADDCAEAALMRVQGATTPTPRAWSPSPVWPVGRGLFILRPLLGMGRSALRAALAGLGETWIEDPGNTDPASLRARSRAALARLPPAGTPVDQAIEGGTAASLDEIRQGPAADLHLPLSRLLGAADGGALLGTALLCAAGTDRPPRRQSLGRLLSRAAEGGSFVATLGGARVSARDGWTHVVRDAADRRRGALDDIALPEGQTIVWDGRFEMTASEAGARVGFLAGRAAALSEPLRRALLASPAAARRAIPLVSHPDGALECPSLVPSRRIRATSLALPRLMAARGGILDEATLRRMAKPVGPS